MQNPRLKRRPKEVDLSNYKVQFLFGGKILNVELIGPSSKKTVQLYVCGWYEECPFLSPISVYALLTHESALVRACAKEYLEDPEMFKRIAHVVFIEQKKKYERSLKTSRHKAMWYLFGRYLFGRYLYGDIAKESFLHCIHDEIVFDFNPRCR